HFSKGWNIINDITDGGDCEVNWDNDAIYYYQANQTMKRNFNNQNSNLYDNYFDWFIGMKYELNPDDPYLVYFGRRKKIEAGIYLARFCKYNEKTQELHMRDAPSGVSAIGAIGINTRNEIMIADYDWSDANTPNRLNLSLDDGLTWSDLSESNVFEYNNGSWVNYGSLKNLLAWRSIGDILFNPFNPDEVWLAVEGIQFKDGSTTTGKFRVLRSNDLGQNWYDYSENLPPFPVMALEYQMGTNGVLFAGTDAGVYYRSPSMAQWECFNNGIPICIITDLDYNPCNGYLYASTQGRAIFKTKVPFVSDYQSVISPPATVVWNKPMRIANDVVIEPGAVLIIKSKVYLSENVRFIVKRSGKLIIDGGHLTNACGLFWHGIEVWGNSNQRQLVTQQGWVRIINGGTIENSNMGIYTNRPLEM
ncbi:MAG: hypothetical protein Q8M92_07795, partial [Candidatus Subteraquimicrobiales bacterium]|nr:hypothetical protein [Candidatus Subteraquimicrobiales bacterium]